MAALPILHHFDPNVVVLGVVDYKEQADAAFLRFADAGMHVVRSTESIEKWPG